MPGAPHETMILLLREHPEWLRALVEVVTKRVLPQKLTLTDSAIRAVDPADVRLDLVFASADGKSWVLVEIQLDEHTVKARKWPLAVAALWNERGVPATSSASPSTGRLPPGPERSSFVTVVVGEVVDGHP